ncbi:hypothetical protein RF11_12872 [Thelohanellus kitauei]|uniref:Uncharacterized protein n=1 Tax=Thelohanellus kitauei TaxID=669202 RepID=A0A0C2IX38_THEKT|nr:hypothetical protein RF11_12872 [Thelohanellus kitauei]
MYTSHANAKAGFVSKKYVFLVRRRCRNKVIMYLYRTPMLSGVFRPRERNLLLKLLQKDPIAFEIILRYTFTPNLAKSFVFKDFKVMEQLWSIWSIIKSLCSSVSFCLTAVFFLHGRPSGSFAFTTLYT